MKVVLLQLPVQSHDYTYPMENVPLGVAYLKVYAESLLPPDIRILLAPHALVNYGGDDALIQWILLERPDVLGFGCYVWNVERSLAIARRVKAECPDVRIVVGGPEVTPENEFLRRSDGFDWGIVGEGEETFAAMLSALRSSSPSLKSLPGVLLPFPGGWQATEPRPVLKTLDQIPSPYLSQALRPSDAGTILLETVRGCPNRCRYCYYHKRFPYIRHFSLARLQEELFWAARHEVSEIYFVDPCFTRRKDSKELLEIIEEARRIHGFTFQCEADAEDVTPALAASLSRAGLTQVEVGLQTINPKALARIQRRFDRNLFIAGIQALRGEGIHVMVDIMVALPEDSLDDVKRSIDFVVDHDLFDEVSLYTLCLLPGTELRRQAAALGITFQSNPPYHVMQTPHMSAEDIRRAYEYAEEISAVDFFPPDLPSPMMPTGIRRVGPYVVSFPVGKAPELSTGCARNPAPSGQNTPGPLGQAVSVYVSPATAKTLENPNVSTAFLSLFEKNPWSLLSFIVTLEDPGFPWATVFSMAQKVLATRDHVIDREYFSTLDPVRSVQIVALLPEPTFPGILLRVPVPHPEESQGDALGSGLNGQQAWVGIPEGIPGGEEDLWIQKIWPFCPPHIRRLRLGDRS